MKCLKCGSEYENEYKICADCNIPLVPDDYKPGDAACTAAGSGGEQPEHVSLLAPFAAHLENTGFLITTEGDSLKAKHPQFVPILLTEHENGIIFEIWFKPTDFANDNSNEFLSFINQCNNDVPVVRSSSRLNEGSFVIDTWIPGVFHKESFDGFIRMMIAEVTGVLMRNPDFQKFLAPWPEELQANEKVNAG